MQKDYNKDMETQVKKKRGRPRKNVVKPKKQISLPTIQQYAAQIRKEPECDSQQHTEVVEREQAEETSHCNSIEQGNENQETITIMGTSHCRNRRWVYGWLDGIRVNIKVARYRKSPRNQPFHCRHIGGIDYEEIR